LVSRSKSEAAELSKADAAKVRDLVVRKDQNLVDWAKRAHPDLRPVQRRATGVHEDATWEGTNDGRAISLSFKSTVRGKPSGLALEHK